MKDPAASSGVSAPQLEKDSAVNGGVLDPLKVNKTADTLFITPISTSYNTPRSIGQTGIRQKSFQLKPSQTIQLTADAADFQLSGFVVCRLDNACRMLQVEHYSDTYVFDSFESLDPAEPAWLQAVHQAPAINWVIFLTPVLAAISIVLFFIWFKLSNHSQKKQLVGSSV